LEAAAERSAQTLPDALAALDARFVAPALQALRAKDLASVTLLANDTRLHLTRHSRWRFWRRDRPGLAGLT
jgi:hypothetical protein